MTQSFELFVCKHVVEAVCTLSQNMSLNYFMAQKNNSLVKVISEVFTILTVGSFEPEGTIAEEATPK